MIVLIEWNVESPMKYLDKRVGSFLQETNEVCESFQSHSIDRFIFIFFWYEFYAQNNNRGQRIV